MATIHIDGKEYEVSGGDNLLRACLSLGLDIPYFCWHPALGSVGACRQCAVKQYANAEDQRGRIVMSCMTPAADGTYISINDEESRAFRASVIEWLMVNHPHDCPVCEEGGHCHLQDMTVMTGHNRRRYRFTKRTHQNQELGPFIAHEMNRCIACYRCVRYYQDYAGGGDLGVFGMHDNVYFGRETDGTLENEFAGNLVEVCPTGVFTDKTHSARYNRKWDMQFAPSICHQCGLGCNISPGERYGELRRIENRYNGAVNHYFLCDRGRFGYGYVNRPDRPRQPLARQGETWVDLTPDNAIANAADALRHARRVMGIGSPRASLEANFALRELVGAENFSCGIEASELRRLTLVRDILQRGPVRTPSLREVETFDAVLILGEDITQSAPRLALAVRQAAKGAAIRMAEAKKIPAWNAEAVKNIGQHDRHPVFIASPAPTRLDDIAALSLRALPDAIAALGFQVAATIEPGAHGATVPTDIPAEGIQHIADALLAAEKPLIIAGTASQSEAVLEAAANLALALHKRGKPVEISLTVPEANSLGLALLGGMSLDDALTTLETGDGDAVVILENDLYFRLDAQRVDRALAAPQTRIVIDHQPTATLERASLVLPAATFAEGDGTLVNNEGRAQRFFQVYDTTYYNLASQIRESWRWLHAIDSVTRNQPLHWSCLDEVTAACAEAVPALARILQAAPGADFRIRGLVKVAREPHRYSGRTAMRANRSVHEPRVPQDVDSPLSFSMEGYSGPDGPAPLIPFAWAPGWNSPQAWNKFQDEVGGDLRSGNPGVRLIEPAAHAAFGYFRPRPTSSAPFEAAWRILPLPQIFGSDELSAQAPPIRERMSTPFIALAPQALARLGATPGQRVRLRIHDQEVQLPALSLESLPDHAVGVPVGLPGVPPLAGAEWTLLSLGDSASAGGQP